MAGLPLRPPKLVPLTERLPQRMEIELRRLFDAKPTDTPEEDDHFLILLRVSDGEGEAKHRIKLALDEAEHRIELALYHFVVGTAPPPPTTLDDSPCRGRPMSTTIGTDPLAPCHQPYLRRDMQNKTFGTTWDCHLNTNPCGNTSKGRCTGRRNRTAMNVGRKHSNFVGMKLRRKH